MNKLSIVTGSIVRGTRKGFRSLFAGECHAELARRCGAEEMAREKDSQGEVSKVWKKR